MDRMLHYLQSNLATGLSFSNPDVKDLAALAFTLLGYKGLYVSLEDSMTLATPLFRSRFR
jgi:anti-sigma factor RsiW